MKYLLLFSMCPALYGQNFSQRGFVEAELTGFPQTTTQDQGNVIGRAFFQWDVAYKVTPWLTFSGGIKAQTDTHRETERSARLDVRDRGLLRPAFSIRTLKATIHHDHLTIDIGKQFIRWGKVDILNPTDRFAPRDYLSVVDNDFLGVTGVRTMIEGGGTSLDLVWTAQMTPSRTPLLYQRWTPLPENFPGRIENHATRFPGGPQYGARVNHVGKGFEGSVSWFEGYNHLPLIQAGLREAPPLTMEIERVYPKIRMVGADFAVPTGWLTLKGEVASIRSRDSKDAAPVATATGLIPAPRSDDYLLYVAQLERQVGELTVAAGYAGQTVQTRRNVQDFDPQRGLTKAFLLHAQYNMGTKSTVTAEVAVRQNGSGTWAKLEYSRAVGNHWRAIVEVAAIAGAKTDFFGQYNRNSHGVFKMRYNF